jgi:hypothetical protein
MDSEKSLHLSKVSRRVIFEGANFTFECALRKDGSSPASEILDQLKANLLEIPDFPTPDDKQTNFYTDLIAFIEDFADGYQPRTDSFNYLFDGVWEFKRDAIRITFYDTDGNGRTHGHQNMDLMTDDFYEIQRLGHSFVKDSQKTSPADKTQIKTTRTEDLDYDRPH